MVARLHRFTIAQVLASDLTVATQFKMQRVAPVDQHEDGLEQVIAVGPAACDVQKHIELGRGWNIVQGLERP